MDKKIEVTPEEQTAEQEALVEAKEDEVRDSIISELELDPEGDADRIEKLVKKEMSHKKSLSQAIGQKIKYRDAANKGVEEVKNEKPEVPAEEAPDIDKKIADALQKERLDGLDYPDDLTDEIKKVAKVQGVSIKKALTDPYIVSKIDTYKQELKVEDAGNTRKNNQGVSKDFDPNNPPKVDMSTEEGRKEWDEWVEKAKNHKG